MPFSLGFWDWVLLLAVPAQATLIAYLHSPRLKALAYCLPVPFSVSFLAIGRPVDATNVVGMVLLLGYTHAVHVLHGRLRWNIIASIACAGLAYAAAGTILFRILPQGPLAFWIAIAAVMAMALPLYLLTPHRSEPGHRSPLPVWLKFLLIFAIISALLAGKSYLGGFITTFPMVGLVAAYEARHSLYTLCRQIPAMLLALAPMVATLGLLQSHIGPGPALIAALVLYLAILLPLTFAQWKKAGRQKL